MHIKIAELLPVATLHKPSSFLMIKTFKAAYEIDKETTLQWLLFIRDKNNGAGRRDFTRTCLLWLRNNDEEVFNKILLDVVLIGRWDDIFFCPEIINDRVLFIIKGHLELNNTLLKKWLPKENSDPVLSRIIAKGIGLTMKEYRLSIKKSEGEFNNTLFRAVDSYKINI